MWAGAVDASLFAARVLGAALVEVGRTDEAFEPLLYALLIAERLDSPVGRARVGLALVELYEARGEGDAAREAARWTIEAAESVGLEAIAGPARTRLEVLPAESN